MSGFNPNYQFEILPNVLYEVKALNIGSERLLPAIEIIGGTGTVYGSEIKPASAPTNMAIGIPNFQGITTFGHVPNYLYVSGSPTKIILSRVKPEVV